MRRLTHPAYMTIGELARWLERSPFTVRLYLKRSGLLHYRRGKVARRWTGFVRWIMVPPRTVRLLLFAHMDRRWQELMQEWPESERRPSPWAAYRGLLTLRSNGTPERCLPWPLRRSTRHVPSWRRLRAKRLKLRQRASHSR